MHIEIQLKKKESGGWVPIQIAEIVGETLREALSGCDGEPVVAEVDVDGNKYYCCGTEELRAMMAPRGRAVVYRDTERLFDQINPGLLEIKMNCRRAEEIFGGSQLEKRTANIPDHEEHQSTFC